MFTGIIEATGEVLAAPAGRLAVDAGGLDLDGLKTGESVCVNGACLTVVARHERRLEFDVSAETLACTTLGDLAPGDRVNLERALRAGDRLGGHLVSGHVDGRGTIRSIAPDGNAVRFEIEAPKDLMRYLCRKGSVAVDGVSLTVNEVRGSIFSVCIIPHTLALTRFSLYRPGAAVNLEADQIARYAERLLHPERT
jgi:riboflavin synthase